MITVPGGGHGEGVWVDEYIERMIAFFTEIRSRKMK
jgi:hypothetical protein